MAPASGADPEADRQRLLELHERQRTAHLEKNADLLVSMLADDFVSIEDGGVERPDREVLRRRFERYFAAVEFLEWSDLVPPEITISTDGTLATIVVHKRVRLRRASRPDAPDEETHFAWLETWRKRERRWELTALASTERVSETSKSVSTPAARSARDEGSASTPVEPSIQHREVAPGVHAALTPPALRFADANATVIVTEREAIVVDVPGRPAQPGGIRRARRRAPAGP